MPAQLKQQDTLDATPVAAAKPARKASSAAPRASADLAAKKAPKARASAAAREPIAAPAENDEPKSWQALSESGQAFYRRNETHLSEDLEYAASKLAVDVAFALSEELEDFDGFDPTFRRGLQRAARRALLWVFRSEKSVVVMPDALPGYTILAFKKDPQAKAPARAASREPAGASLDDGGFAQESLEGQAAARIVSEFMKTRKDSRVMAIESADAVLALFPASDTRHNLREMGFWFTAGADD